MEAQMFFTAKEIAVAGVAFAARQMHAAMQAAHHVLGRARRRRAARFQIFLENHPHDDDRNQQKNQFAQILPSRPA